MGLSVGAGPNLTTMNTRTQINPTELQATIKLGIDAHAKSLLMDSLFHPFRSRPHRKAGDRGGSTEDGPDPTRLPCAHQSSGLLMPSGRRPISSRLMPRKESSKHALELYDHLHRSRFRNFAIHDKRSGHGPVFAGGYQPGGDDRILHG